MKEKINLPNIQYNFIVSEVYRYASKIYSDINDIIETKTTKLYKLIRT